MCQTVWNPAADSLRQGPPLPQGSAVFAWRLACPAAPALPAPLRLDPPRPRPEPRAASRRGRPTRGTTPRRLEAHPGTRHAAQSRPDPPLFLGPADGSTSGGRGVLTAGRRRTRGSSSAPRRGRRTSPQSGPPRATGAQRRGSRSPAGHRAGAVAPAEMTASVLQRPRSRLAAARGRATSGGRPAARPRVTSAPGSSPTAATVSHGPPRPAWARRARGLRPARAPGAWGTAVASLRVGWLAPAVGTLAPPSGPRPCPRVRARLSGAVRERGGAPGVEATAGRLCAPGVVEPLGAQDLRVAVGAGDQAPAGPTRHEHKDVARCREQGYRLPQQSVVTPSGAWFGGLPANVVVRPSSLFPLRLPTRALTTAATTGRPAPHLSVSTGQPV